MDVFPSFRALDTQYIDRRIGDPRFAAHTFDYGHGLAVLYADGDKKQGTTFHLDNPSSAKFVALSFNTRKDFLDWFADTARDKLLAWASALE